MVAKGLILAVYPDRVELEIGRVHAELAVLMQNFPPLIQALTFAVLFFTLYAALGRRFLALTRLTPSGLRPVEGWLVETMVGMGAIQALPISLALFGALSPFSARIGILVLTLLLAPDLWQIARDFVGMIKRWRPHRLSWQIIVYTGLLAVFLAVLLMHALFLGFTDDDGYHLAAPWRWLREGTLSYLPSYTHTNSGLAFEMSYLIALAFNAVLGAKLLHFGAGVLLLVTTLTCAQRLGAPAAGAMAISLLMITTPLVQTPSLFTVAYVDLPACFSVMIAILLWIVWRETCEQKLLWCIALCAGFTASFKFTALAVLVAWSLLVAVELHAQGRRLVPSLIVLIKFGLIAAAPTLPWFARNWYLTGNPVYPMATFLFPSRDWTAEQGAIFSTYIKLFSWGVASGASMGEPTRKLLLLVSAIGVLAGSTLVYWAAKDRGLRLLVCFSAVYILLCIALTGLVFRYWLPGIVCMLLVICALVARILEQHFSRVLYVPALALMVLALGVQSRQEIQKGTLPRDFRVAVGISSHENETRDDPAERMWRFVQKNTPADARVLVAAFYSTFGASSFGCFRAQRHCFTTDSHLQTYINLTDWPSFLRSIKQANVQYVLLSDQQFASNRQGFSYQAGENEYQFCMRLARDAGTKIFEAGHFQLYKIGGQGAAASF